MDAITDVAQAGDALVAEAARRGWAPAVVAAVSVPALPLARHLAARWAVPCAVELAQELPPPLDAGDAPIGAVDAEGRVVLDYPVAAGLRLDDAQVEEARANALGVLGPLQDRHASEALPRYLPAPVVLLVDASLPRGLAMQAVWELARRHGAEQVVVATPQASATAAARFRDQDEAAFVCLRVEEDEPALA